MFCICTCSLSLPKHSHEYLAFEAKTLCSCPVSNECTYLLSAKTRLNGVCCYCFLALVRSNRRRNGHRSCAAAQSHTNSPSDSFFLRRQPGSPSLKLYSNFEAAAFPKSACFFHPKDLFGLVPSCCTPVIYVRVRYSGIEPQCLFCTCTERLAP